MPVQVGVFGGCFDPPHKGHLAVAEASLRTGRFDQILIVPAAIASEPEAAMSASAADRMNMCRLCFQNESRCIVSDIEARKDGWVPTITTIEKLQRQNITHEKLTLIVGADKAESMPRWKRSEDLFRLCDILVCPRSGLDISAPVERLRALGANVSVLDVAEAPGASRAIQQALQRYEAPSELPTAVTAYIAEHWLYLDPHILEAEGLMTPKRWKHTLGVRSEAVRLAAIHGINPLKAALAAVLHDSAKCLPFDDMLLLAHQAGIRDETFLSSSAMLHGPLGAVLARTRFGVEDPDVLNAITYHTVGRADMSPLEMCIFVADATEPGRDYQGLRRLRKLADRSLEAAVLLSLNLTRHYVLSSGKPFNPISEATIRWIRPRVPAELLPLTTADHP